MLNKVGPVHRLSLFVVAAICALFISCSGTSGSASSGTTTSNPPQTPLSSHVAIVLLENTAYSDVIGSSSMPFLNSLAGQYAVATNYFADAHPSLPNYFALTAGKTITLDDNFAGMVNDDNMVRELNKAGRSWKAYAESLPSVGYLGGDVPPYLKHHNPFVYFSDVVDNSSQQQNVVPFSQFAADLGNGTLPNFSFIVPNELDDAHSCPASNPACSTADLLSAADSWLQSHIGPLLSNAAFTTDGLLVIVFDESAESDVQNGGGHVAMVLAGPGVRRGFRSTTFFQHESLLRMMLTRLGVTTYPGGASSAPAMDEFFTSP